MNRIDDVLAVFREDADGVAAPAGIVGRSLEQGRTIRRRRHIGTAAAAVVLTGTAVLVPLVLSEGAQPDTPQVAATPDSGPTVGLDGSAARTGPAPTIPYAVGSTIVDGDLVIQAPRQITTFRKAGARYAVMSPDPGTAGLTQLDLVSADGSVQPIDTGEFYGLAATEIDGRAVIAWGGTTVKKLWLDETEPLEVDAGNGDVSGGVFGFAGADVVFGLTTGTSVPLVWAEGADPQPLLEGSPSSAQPVLVGPGVLVLLDSGSGCSYGIRLDDPTTRLWEDCFFDLLSGDLSPDGEHVINRLEVTDPATGAPTVVLNFPFEVGEFDVLNYGWESADAVLISGSPDGGTSYAGIARCSITTGACEKAAITTDANLVGPIAAGFGAGTAQ